MGTGEGFADFRAVIAQAIDDGLIAEGWLDHEYREKIVRSLAGPVAIAASLYLATEDTDYGWSYQPDDPPRPRGARGDLDANAAIAKPHTPAEHHEEDGDARHCG